jgi:hypothetical protein
MALAAQAHGVEHGDFLTIGQMQLVVLTIYVARNTGHRTVLELDALMEGLEVGHGFWQGLTGPQRVTSHTGNANWLALHIHLASFNAGKLRGLIHHDGIAFTHWNLHGRPGHRTVAAYRSYAKREHQ